MNKNTLLSSLQSPADMRRLSRGKQILLEDPAGNVVELFKPAGR